MEITIDIFGVELSRGFITFIIAMIIIAGLMSWAKNKIGAEKNYRITSVSSGIVDILFMFIYDLVKGLVGEDLVEEFMPLGLSLFFTLLLANTLSLIGLQEATTDLIVPITLVITLFVAWTFYAIKKIGLIGYGKGIIGDSVASWCLAPLEVMGRFTSPLSMSVRIFGNILSGFIIMNLIWILMANMITGGYAILAAGVAAGAIGHILGGLFLWLLTLGMSILSMALIGYFSIFSPVIQALVFTSLTLANFKGLLEEE